MTKIRFWCKDCGIPLEKNVDLCPLCKKDRIKERERMRKYVP